MTLTPYADTVAMGMAMVALSKARNANEVRLRPLTPAQRAERGLPAERTILHTAPPDDATLAQWWAAEHAYSAALPDNDQDRALAGMSRQQRRAYARQLEKEFS
jgi:hypothetical protein